MPEWVSLIVSVAVGGLVQGGIALYSYGRFTTKLDRALEDVARLDDKKLNSDIHHETVKRVDSLAIDVKDVQRNKVDRDLHDSAIERVAARIEGAEKHLDHKINNMGQRVALMEATKR